MSPKVVNSVWFSCKNPIVFGKSFGQPGTVGQKRDIRVVVIGGDTSLAQFDKRLGHDECPLERQEQLRLKMAGHMQNLTVHLLYNPRHQQTPHDTQCGRSPRGQVLSLWNVLHGVAHAAELSKTGISATAQPSLRVHQNPQALHDAEWSSANSKTSSATMSAVVRAVRARTWLRPAWPRRFRKHGSRASRRSVEVKSFTSPGRKLRPVVP